MNPGISPVLFPKSSVSHIHRLQFLLFQCEHPLLPSASGLYIIFSLWIIQLILKSAKLGIFAIKMPFVPTPKKQILDLSHYIALAPGSLRRVCDATEAGKVLARWKLVDRGQVHLVGSDHVPAPCIRPDRLLLAQRHIRLHPPS